jgi:hypothetical protein
MRLFIEVANGNASNHPAFEDNLMQAFGCIPDNWEPFIRIPRPEMGTYDVLDSDMPTYQKIDGSWVDVWMLRPMTAEEKNDKQQAVKDAWAARDQAENWSAWVFNESTCQYDPPIPRPEPVEGLIVFWSGAEGDWKVAPAHPQDGKPYKFDFLAWAWVEVAQ